MEIKIKGTYPTVLDILAVIGIYVVAAILSGFFARLLGSFMSDLMALGTPEEQNAINVQGFTIFVSYLLTMAITILYTLYNRKMRLGKLNRSKLLFNRFNPLMLLWGVLLMLMASVAIDPISALFPDNMNQMYERLGNSSWMIATTILLAPVLEEFLFRGIIQEDITRKFGPVRGIFFSALIFGVVHFNPVQVIGAFVLGLVLSFIYYKTRSLLVVIFMHFINNLLAQFIYMIYGSQGTSLSLKDFMPAPVYYIVYTVCCFFLLYTIYRIIRLQKITDAENVGHVVVVEEPPVEEITPS